MSRSRTLHEFIHRGERYRICEPAMGRRPHLLQREDGGDWFLDHETDDRLSDEILRLRGLLEEVDGLPESAQFPGDAHPVFYIPRDLRDRIRQALHREGEE